MSDLPCMRHSRASLHGENPNRILNGEVRSQFSLYKFSLSGQTSRLVRTSDPRCYPGPSIDVGCTRCAGERVHRVFLLHGTGTPTADELTRVNSHLPSIFLASP